MKICIECEQEVTVKELLELLSNLKPETTISFIPQRSKLLRDGLPNIGDFVPFPFPSEPGDFYHPSKELKITF